MTSFDHGGDVRAAAKAHRINIEKILDFSANINPLGMVPKGLLAIKDEIPSLIHYPDPFARTLHDAIAKTYGMPEENIALGNGAAELIYALCRLPGLQHCIVTAPTFSEYQKGAEAAKLSIHEIAVPIERELTQMDFKDSVTPWSQCIIFLGHPNNPDGKLLSPKTLTFLLETVEKGTYVVIDESFIDFVNPDKSYRSWIQNYPNLIILHSYTKFYACPGLRIGALYANTDIVKSINTYIPTWSVNTLAQAYAREAIQDIAYHKKSRTYIQKENHRVFALYQSLSKIQPIVPQANFMLLKWESSVPLEILQSYLLKKNMLIRNGNTYHHLQGEWFRIAIKKQDENQQLYEAIKEFLHE